MIVIPSCVRRCAAVLCISVLVCAVARGQEALQYASASARPAEIDRGASALWQDLQKLKTRASLLMIVAHPDDEDGGLLAYESRGHGVDTNLLSLTRGEGGQNLMSDDYWDRLGEVRTQELLAASEAYGAHLYFTRAADYGFSKSLEEAMRQWGHDRVLYDVVRVVRMTRPLVLSSVFVGAISDGHGHHQMAGVMAQEVYDAAGDPKVFPDQIAAGLRPWTPLKMYARVPRAQVSDKGIFDYATGHYGVARFHDYIHNSWIEGVPPATVTLNEGAYSPLLGDSFAAVARAGLGEQKTQNGGTGLLTARAAMSRYHLYASRVTASLPTDEATFFDGIDTSLAGIASYVPEAQQAKWREQLNSVAGAVEQAMITFDATTPARSAVAIAKGLEEAESLLAEVRASSLPDDAKYNMGHELEIKCEQFNQALADALGLSVLASLPAEEGFGPGAAGEGGAGRDASFQSVVPGESFRVEVHLANQGSDPVEIVSSNVVSNTGEGWRLAPEVAASGTLAKGEVRDEMIAVTAPEDAAITRPYFSRKNLEQSYYDIDDPRLLNLPTMPYPLSAEVTYRFGGVVGRLSGVVQTSHRYVGPGPVLEPLLVAPAISLTVAPVAGVVPIGETTLPLEVTLHSSSKVAAKGTLRLELPAGWTSEPASVAFDMARYNDERVVRFVITPKDVEEKPYTITAVAKSGGRSYREGFVMAGYVGVRPYPYYRPASYQVTGVNLKVALGLRVAYVMGTGDDVPQSLNSIGVHVAMLSAEEVRSGDLSSYDAIVLGVRAYTTRPELARSNQRLLDYVKAGGVVIVQYQSGEFDHNYGPYPLTMRPVENVIEEDSKVTILAPDDPLLNWPNRIREADFNGWVEERGHSFMHSWDPHFTVLTEMHDVGQDPQRGGLLYAHYGRGAYIYTAYAFFRQMPEGVPGAFRIMANLISVGKNPQFQAANK